MRRLRLSLFLAAITLLGSLSFQPAASAGPDYVLCSCQLCSRSDVDCQISPSGYTIACADYYAAHCKS
jgi:hypothetical protein